MLEEGPRVILRLSKIRRAVIGYPEPLMWFCSRRMERDMLSLYISFRLIQQHQENGVLDESDFMLNALLIRDKEIRIQMRLRNVLEGSSLNDLNELDIRLLM